MINAANVILTDPVRSKKSAELQKAEPTNVAVIDTVSVSDD
jgi:hypothetical protein